jgi:hypothetical protein
MLILILLPSINILLSAAEKNEHCRLCCLFLASSSGALHSAVIDNFISMGGDQTTCFSCDERGQSHLPKG